MKKFLQNKWIGPVIVMIYVICIAFLTAKQLGPALKETYPLLAKETEQFLPITITDGVITDPQNKVVTKTYDFDDENFVVTLDTRTDEFNPVALAEEGVYISKKCIYVVTGQKTTTECFDSKTNQTITVEDIKQLADRLDHMTDKYLFWFLMVGLFVIMYVVILFYTILMHWLLALTFKVPFSQTLFINTVMYIFLSLIVLFGQIDFKFLLTFGLLLATNAGICALIKKQDA